MGSPANEPREGAVTANGYRTHAYYLSTDLHERLKAAWWATRDLADGQPSMSTTVAALFGAEANRLELAHNGGERFPAAPRNARGAEDASTTAVRRTHGYYLNHDLHERLKAAWWGTRDLADGRPSMNAIVAALFEAEANRLELAHNGGERFPPAPRNARGVDPAAARRQGRYMEDVWAGRRAQP